MEFLIVEFEDDCGVIMNGAIGAWRTNQTLQFQAGTYVATLDLPPGRFTPPQVRFILQNTAPGRPMLIAFQAP